MRPILPLCLLLFPGTALAHPGHLGDLAGHDHWVAGVAIGLAIALGLWGVLKGGDKQAPETAEDADEAEA